MKTDTPLVSVVSCYFNRQNDVEESIRSLIAQTYPNIEIIVVDDGSTDGTWDVLQTLSDPRLKLVRIDNGGFTAAIRHAVALSSGEYVAVHGSGDISLPARIARQVEVLQERPDVGLVSCHYDIPGNRVDIHSLRPIPLQGALFDAAFKVNAFTHGQVMYRRSLYDRVGGYRPFFRFAQDRDLWLRMGRHTLYVVVPEILYIKTVLADDVSANVEKLLLQCYFSDFAVQLARRPDLEGPDLLDRYGAGAGLMRRPSPALGRRLLTTGLKWRLYKGDAAGLRLLEAARSEHARSPAALLCRIAAAPAGSMVWRLVVRPLVALAFGVIARKRRAGRHRIRPVQVPLAAGRRPLAGVE